ncbi:MAG: HAMP domain-containing protein, partial [Proteobacteria bacterium]|nr:HAMP domain-containing protein [Pseudomonadota bacterium]
MQRRLLIVILASVIAVSVVASGFTFLGWGEPQQVIEDMATTAVFGPEQSFSDDPVTLRAHAHEAGEDCAAAVPRWWTLLRVVDDDPEAYKSIALCSRVGQMGSVLKGTQRLFEESPLLSWMPQVLEDVPFREVIPILNKLEQKKDKDNHDYRLIAILRSRLKDPVGTVEAFKRALSLDPSNAELRLELGNALLSQGRVDEARLEFRDALAKETSEIRMTRIYAVAVAYPWYFFGVVLGVLGLGAILMVRWEPTWLTLVDRTVGSMKHAGRWWFFAGMTLTVVLLTSQFYRTADRIAFALLVGLVLATAVWIVLVPLRRPLARSVGALLGGAADVVTGSAHRRIGSLGPHVQLAILVGTGLTIVFLIPMIPRFDVRIGVLFLTGMLLFTTVGSLFLAMLDQVASLRFTLRGLAVAGTLPLLLFALYSDLKTFLQPLRHGQMLGPDEINRLVGYGLISMLGVGAALLLAGILSRSILNPLHQVTDVLQAIRRGDFDARVSVERRDEIGEVAEMVNLMAAGLREREEIKQIFSRYVDPTVAERLIAKDESVTKGRAQRATVLFSDVRGFTSMSEQLTPQEVVTLLNEYFACMEPIIRRWGGVVDKFIGDGMMAVWDVPEPRTSGELVGIAGEELAVKAGMEMLDVLQQFNESLSKRGLPALAIG